MNSAIARTHEYLGKYSENERLQGYFNLRKSNVHSFGKASRWVDIGCEHSDMSKKSISTRQYHVPGPCYYAPQDYSSLSKQGVSFAKSKRNELWVNKLDLSKKNLSPAERSKMERRCATARQTKKDAELRSSTPGPGAYTPRVEKFDKAPKGVSFGKASRQVNTILQATGGSTKQEAEVRYLDALSTTGYKEKLWCAPGPGQYEVNVSTFVTAKGQKSKEKYQASPIRDRAKGGVMSRTGRRPLSKGDLVPGPGFYTPLWGAI